jgi:hypothetical protein
MAAASPVTMAAQRAGRVGFMAAFY